MMRRLRNLWLFVLLLTLGLVGQRCEGWWSKTSYETSTSSSNSESEDGDNDRVKTVKAFGQTARVGEFGTVRDRDETGHRTGLWTLAKKFVSQPKKTVKAIGEMVKSYDKMIEKNQIGGNLAAHEEGNKNAAETSDRETAAALSAAREQYKRFRVKQSKADGNWHIGDTRTQQEIDNTMNANKKGREKAGGSD
ncbi:PREDICTED: uncharacterized protein LOC107358347 [Acropora digitifera]|uniref:uncharacterized protein LOC107358347 n=1 Tax=Acropora digitifera TaxID=70779 RepID=UPI00077AD1B9|nr:PREDICTED: uncharacterized protein LOC107358347 [Acropora digitifera]